MMTIRSLIIGGSKLCPLQALQHTEIFYTIYRLTYRPTFITSGNVKLCTENLHLTEDKVMRYWIEHLRIDCSHLTIEVWVTSF